MRVNAIPGRACDYRGHHRRHTAYMMCTTLRRRSSSSSSSSASFVDNAALAGVENGYSTIYLSPPSLSSFNTSMSKSMPQRIYIHLVRPGIPWHSYMPIYTRQLCRVVHTRASGVSHAGGPVSKWRKRALIGDALLKAFGGRGEG